MKRSSMQVKSANSAGFTLLEIILAMFVFSLLVASIFGIVSGTTQLADEMERSHEHDAQAHSFAQFCERTLRQLPAQAVVRLKVKEEGRQYLSQLALLNAPSILGSGAGGGNGLTIIETKQQPDGYQSIQVRLVAAEDVPAYEAGQDKSGPGLVLLNDVGHCEWKFFNPLSNQWESVWNNTLSLTPFVAASQVPGLSFTTPPADTTNPVQPTTPGAAPVAPNASQTPRPTLVELTLAIRTESPRRFIFWVPPAQTPQNATLPSTPTGITPVPTPSPVPGPTPGPVPVPGR